VAAALHVPVRYIHALENDDFSALPPAVYTRAMAREYARYLGLKPEEVLPQSIPMRPQDRHPIRPAISPLEKPLPVSWKAVMTVGAIALSAGLFLYLYDRYNSFNESVDFERGPRVEILPTPARAVSVLLTPLASTTPTAVFTPAPTATPIQGLVVEARIIDRTWLQVWTDGRAVTAETFQAGVTRTFSASQSVRMRLGNAGGVDVTVNGVPQGRLGTTGQALDVSWSRG
jgi:hypothetical protein